MTTCAECVHVGVCRDYILSLSKAKGKDIDESKLVKLETMFDTDGCEHFKDRSRFVELPCDLGQTVYIHEPRLDRIHRQKRIVVKQATVYGFGYSIESGKRIDVEISSGKIGKYFRTFKPGDLGKTIFFTREEAEAAMKKQNYEEES